MADRKEPPQTMKHEFEARINTSVSPECYDRIEYVYTHCPLFSEGNGKQEIADFYKRFDMNGIERLYHALREIFALMKEEKNYSAPWQVVSEYAERLSPTEMDYHAYIDRFSVWWKEYTWLARTGGIH